MSTLPTTETIRYLGPVNRKPVAREHRRKISFESTILEEFYFLHLLRLERKRSERSSNPFMLMLFDVELLMLSPDRERTLRQIMSAVASSTRETDTLGWYEHDRKLGVIFSDIGTDNDANVSLIITKITCALQKALAFTEFDAADISFRMFPEEHHLKSQADFTFYPDLSKRHQPRTAEQFVKRAIDVAGSLIALLLLFPLFAVVALLVKLSSEGPILFRQKRVGQHGAAFTFLKFRSMYANNDPRVHQEYVAKLIAGKGDLKQPGAEGGVFKLTNDPRITPLGRFLRKSSLDELPQLLNVLKGEMSLVGPRPPVPYEFEKYDVWHRRRVLEVKPGITGLWQVYGRSKTSFDEMVRLDLQYAKVWSVWLDLKILLKTPAAVVSADGAY